jgi:hypothetical protein
MEKLPEVMVRLEHLSSLGPSFPFLYLNDDARMKSARINTAITGMIQSKVSRAVMGGALPSAVAPLCAPQAGMERLYRMAAGDLHANFSCRPKALAGVISPKGDYSELHR